MEKKMTYAVALDKAIAAVADAEVVERLTALKASLERKRTKKTDAPSKVAVANATITEKVASVLESGASYSSADLIGIVPELEKASPTKVSVIMKPLVANGSVTVGKTKGKVIYTVA